MKLFQRLDTEEGDSTLANALIQVGKKYQQGTHNGFYLIVRSPFIKKDQLIVNPYTFEIERADVVPTRIWVWRRIRNQGKMLRMHTKVFVPKTLMDDAK